MCIILIFFFFFFNDTATTEIYPLPLHDALPICPSNASRCRQRRASSRPTRDRAASSSRCQAGASPEDRKSTRLNSSHLVISYAVFCLKKKKISEESLRRLKLRDTYKHWQSDSCC